MNLIDAISNAISKVEWSFESHDPVWAWLIVAMYAVAAILCLRALFMSQRSLFPEVIKKKSKVFWAVLFAIMLFLACNKQLDIQTYITAVGREVANTQGWYDQRRFVQKEFIIVLGLVAFLFLFYLAYIVYYLPTGNKISMIGALCTFTFIGMRAASFHHLDHFVARTFLGVKLHILVEICGGSIVSLGALMSSRSVGKWELYYDRHFSSKNGAGLLNTDFDLESDLDSDEIGSALPVSALETHYDIPGSEVAITENEGTSYSEPVMASYVPVEDMKPARTSESIYSEYSDREKQKPSFTQLVSGLEEKAKPEATPAGLFERVSDPQYSDLSKPVVDNSSPRVSREKLVEVNRKRREMKSSLKSSGGSDSAVKTAKGKKGREDNWLTRDDETGWI